MQIWKSPYMFLFIYYKNKTLKISLRENGPNTKFSGPYFRVFGLYAEIYSLNLRIQSEYRKIRTRKFRIWTLFTQFFLTVNFVNFLKNRLISILFYCFWMFVNKLFTHLTFACLKTKRCFNVKSSTNYFHVQAKISADY